MKSLNALAALPRTNLLQALHARGVSLNPLDSSSGLFSEMCLIFSTLFTYCGTFQSPKLALQKPMHSLPHPCWLPIGCVILGKYSTRCMDLNLTKITLCMDIVLVCMLQGWRSQTHT